MKYTIDTHTHTLVSGHAYNTIDEMAAYAAGIGVTHLAITDHAPKMPGSAVNRRPGPPTVAPPAADPPAKMSGRIVVSSIKAD